MPSEKLYRVIRSVALLLCVLLYLPATTAFAISNEQIQTLDRGIMYFNVDVGSSCSGGSATLIGSDNPTKTWNFFKSKGLDDMHVAAIMGNLQQEANFNPTAVEGNTKHPELPRTSTDPTNLPIVDGWPPNGGTRQPGWGIAQWTPSAKVIAKASENNITGDITQLATQLQLVWAEMNGVSPTGAKKMIDGFKNTTTLEQATAYFDTNYEAAGVVGPRLALAQASLARYQSTGSSSTSTSCGYLPPNCTSASGVAKILCDAKAYDPVSYMEAVSAGHQGGAAWHATCPTINASCYLDCSGLVNIAVYDAFGVDLKENVLGMYNDTKNWQHVSFNQVVPGDLVLPTGTSHVEIVDHVQGNTIYTFGSHTSSLPQPDQVGTTSMQYQSSFTFLHYIGSGS